MHYLLVRLHTPPFPKMVHFEGLAGRGPLPWGSPSLRLVGRKYPARKFDPKDRGVGLQQASILSNYHCWRSVKEPWRAAFVVALAAWVATQTAASKAASEAAMVAA